MPPEAEVSYPAATQQERPMTGAIANDPLPVASRQRSSKPSAISASALALHLDLTRQRICVLADEQVFERLPDGGFDLDASRVAYIRFLRRERQRSPRSEADAAHLAVKTELLKVRLMQKKRELVLRTDADALIDQIAGTVLTHLGGMAARCSRDMVVRRNIDAVVDQVRRDIASACLARADECGEPQLDGLD
jgi:hypothetical protein